MICNVCNTRVPHNARWCPSCQVDVGFPNVRASQAIAEKQALKDRLNQAQVSTKARGCSKILGLFGHHVSNSKAVYCRSLDCLSELLSSENNLYINFHRQIASGSRLPKDEMWEMGRPAVEATLFPNYHQEINIACLTLDKKGLTNYGAYSIILKEKMISSRASVFEENPFTFMQRHKISVGQPIPPGYRASWKQRNEFAMAKLHSKIDQYTNVDNFPAILLKQGIDTASDEFIEVHIYGPISPLAIDCIVGPRPVKKDDLVLWKSLKTKCDKFGIVLEER